MISENDMKQRVDELSPEDKEKFQRMIHESKKALKTMSKNDLIRVVQELSIKISILENVVNNALEEQNKKEEDEKVNSNPA
jgi:hypothetical protein